MKSSVRTFFFGRDPERVDICIPEVLDSNYGMHVWPCAPVLAQYIWHQRQRLRGKQVLELGAGTSLPGVLAAKLGAWVTLSDTPNLPLCIDNCRKSCVSNGLDAKVSVIPITWGQFSPELLQLARVDIILGSDCFYDTKDFEDIILTVSFLCDKNPQAEFWTTYQERSSDRSIALLLQKWDLECRHIDLGDFHADSAELAGSDLPGDHTIHMMVITSKRRQS